MLVFLYNQVYLKYSRVKKTNFSWIIHIYIYIRGFIVHLGIINILQSRLFILLKRLVNFYVLNNKFININRLNNCYRFIYDIIIFSTVLKKEIPFSKQKIDFVLYQLITLLYSFIKNFYGLGLLILGAVLSILYPEHTFISNIANICFNISYLIILLHITMFWINNISFEENFPILHNIIFYLLIILLLFILYLICLNIVSICIDISYFFLKSNIISKVKDWKSSVVDKNFKRPVDPRDPKSKVFFWEKKRKQKEKVDSLNRKYWEDVESRQNNNWNNPAQNTSDVELNSEQKPFSQRRNWTDTIDIGERPTLTNADLEEKAQKELNDYIINQKKSKKIIRDTILFREKFYPFKARTEFRENIKVIEILKDNLKSIIENLRKKD